MAGPIAIGEELEAPSPGSAPVALGEELEAPAGQAPVPLEQLAASHQPPPMLGARPAARGWGSVSSQEMEAQLAAQRLAEPGADVNGHAPILPLAASHEPMTGDEADQEMLARYTRWSVSKEQKSPELQARVLRVATALRDRPDGPQPTLDHVVANLDAYERELAGEDWAALARRHPRLGEFGVNPKVQPLLVDDAAALSGVAAFLGGWEVVPNGNPQEATSVRLKTAPAWAKYLRDGALNVGRSLLEAERAAGFATPDVIADPTSALGVRLTTGEESAARRDALIEQMKTAPTAYASSTMGRVLGGLVSMAPLIAGDTGSRAAGAAAGAGLGAFTGPAAPVMVPLLAAGGQWLGSWLFNTAQTVGPLQEQLAQVDDGTGQPLGMERARPFAWAAAQVEAAVMATGFGRAMRGAPGAGAVLQRLEGQAVARALTSPTVLRAWARQGALYGAHVVEGTATMAAAAAVDASAVELARAQYGGEADWARVGHQVQAATERAVVDMAILTAWGPFRQAVRETAQIRKYGPEQLQLASMRAAAKDSKLFQRSEAEGERAAEALLQDLPQAPREVFADVSRWDAEAKARGQDPRQLAADVIGDGGAAYDLAKAAGENGDLAIPTAKALVRVLRTDLGDALAQDLKLSRSGYTTRQLVVEKGRVMARVRELAAVTADKLEGEARDIYEEERAKALAGLKGTAAEKDAEKVADTHGRLEAATAATLAERYGGTAKEWHDKVGGARTTILGPESEAAAAGAGGLPAGPPKKRRGEFRVQLDGAGEETFTVQLFEQADRTTLAHETSHRLAHALGKAASAEGAPEALRADYQVLLGAMKFGSHEERVAAGEERKALARRKAAGAELTPEETKRLETLTAKEERFSHLWEQYLSTGRAPTAELAGVFRRFKNWMLQAYRGAGGAAGQFAARFKGEPPLVLTPEVKGVFDRLLATDEELALAERAAGAQPFEGVLERMTPEQRAVYQQERDRARGAAEAMLAERIAAANSREDAAWFMEERARLEAEVSAELDQNPVHRAIDVLRGDPAPGLPAGTAELLKDEHGNPPKLNRALLVKVYGKELVAALPRGIFAEKGGRSPVDLAVPLGFETGDDLVRALHAAEPRAQLVEREARRRLDELYGPSLVENRDALAEAALDAVHTPEGMKASIRAMGAMAARLGPEAVARVNALSPELLRAYARRILAGRAMSQVSPVGFLRAERAEADRAREAYRAGREADGLKADEARLVNQALYTAATELRDQVVKAEARVRQAGGEPWRVALGKAGAPDETGRYRSSWRDASDAIRQAVGMGPPPSPGQVRVSFDTMVAEAEAAGATLAFDLDGVRELLQTPRSWRELTPDQAQLVADALTNIRKAANVQNQFKMMDRIWSKDDVIGRMAEAVAQVRKPKPPGPRDRLLETAAYQVGQKLQGWDGLLLETETMLDMLGGGDRTSIFHQAILDPFLAARNRKEELAKQYLQGIVERFDKVPKEVRRRLFEEIDISGDLPLDPSLAKAANLDGPVTRSYLLMVALNMGNEGNKQRLLDGYGWTEDQVVAALGKHLTRAELEFTQGVVDSLEGLWPQLAELHERETGLPPGKVRAKAWKVPLADGTTVELAGGYFPAKYDPRPGMSQRGEAAQERAAQGMIAPYSLTPSTAKGHTKERAIRVEDVIDLSWGVVPQHVNQVLHDLAYRSFVRQTAALLADPRTEALITGYLGPERWRQFIPWLQAVGSGAAAAVPAHERAAHSLFQELKGRATVQALGHSFANVVGDLSNPLVALAAGEVSMKQLAIATTKMAAHPFQTMEWARSLSPELRFRAEKATAQLQAELGAMAGQAGKTNPTLQAVRETAFWAQEQTDKLTATPVWIARFNAELAKGATQAEAVRAADGSVRHVFPAETPAEKAAIFRSRFGGWLAFYGYMNKLYQVNRALVDEAYLRSVDPSGARGKSKGEVLGRLVGVAIASGVVSELLSGRGREDDETWGEWLTRKTVAAPFQSLPWVGGPAEAVISKAQGKPARVGVRTAPGMEAGLAFLKNLGRAYEQGALSEEGAAAAVQAIGFGLNVPTRQLVKTGGYALGGGLASDLEAGRPGDALEGLLYGQRPRQPATALDAAMDAAEAAGGQ